MSLECPHGSVIGGVDAGRRNEIGPQKMRRLFRVDPVIFVFSAVDVFEIERMGEPEFDRILLFLCGAVCRSSSFSDL
jgi:hypothetical protein